MKRLDWKRSEGVRPWPASAGTVRFTPSWRIIGYLGTGAATERLYLALLPECLVDAYALIFPLLDEKRLNHRHAREPEVLAAYAGHPWWAGKAVIIDLPPGAPLAALAAEVDAALAGKGFTGPDVVPGAQAFGGQTGLVFLRREPLVAADAPESEFQRKRLERLLGL